MSLARPAVAAVLIPLLIITAACTSTKLEPSPGPSAVGTGDPVLAFVINKTIKLSDNNGNTHNLATMISEPEQLLWSPDGKRLAWADVTDGNHAVHVIDVATGTAKDYPCPCRGLAFLGDDLATVSADGAHLVLIPRQGDPTRVAFRQSFTSRYTAAWAKTSSEVVAGGRDRVTVSVPLDETKVGVRGQSTLYSVDRSGTVRPMLTGKEGASIRQALASPAGDRIAWLDVPSSGACWHHQSIVDMAYDDRHPTDPQLPADQPLRQAHLPSQRTVLSYSWAGSGIVQTFGPVGGECQVMYPFRLVSYYRQGTRWEHLATGLLGIAFGAEGRIAKLVPQSIIKAPDGSRTPPGRLTLSVPGAEDRTLDENVRYFAFTPAQSAAAHVVTASPQPSHSATSPATTDDHGTSLSGPLYEAAQKVWSAAQSGDLAALLALCHNCDAATRAWVRADGVAEVRLLLTTHPKRLKETLTYPGLVAAECADTSDNPATCTKEQLNDVVALGLESDVSLDYPTNVYRAPSKRSLLFKLDDGAGVWAGRA